MPEVWTRMDKIDFKIDWCSHEAAKYACQNWHYSKCMPVGKVVKIGVWENKKFIGCVLFSHTVGPNVAKNLGFSNFELCELVRVALTKHKTTVSRIVRIAISMLKKHCSGLKCIVSLADPFQNHKGGIYQAGNWFYIGRSGKTMYYEFPDGRILHSRTANPNNKHFGSKSKDMDITGTKKIYREGKHKYLMPLTKKMRKQILPLSKPYPK